MCSTIIPGFQQVFHKIAPVSPCIRLPTNRKEEQSAVQRERLGPGVRLEIPAQRRCKWLAGEDPDSNQGRKVLRRAQPALRGGCRRDGVGLSKAVTRARGWAGGHVVCGGGVRHCAWEGATGRPQEALRGSGVRSGRPGGRRHSIATVLNRAAWATTQAARRIAEGGTQVTVGGKPTVLHPKFGTYA